MFHFFKNSEGRIKVTHLKELNHTDTIGQLMLIFINFIIIIYL